MTGPLRDLALALGLVAYAVKRRLRTGSGGTAVRARNGRVGGLRRRAAGPRILVHGVSVGETHALEPLVGALAASPAAPDVVVSASTATGFERAVRLHAGRHEVVRFPLDFTWMARRFLGGVRPELVVLGELELWPSFLAACARRGIAVCVVNGRLSERSYRGYRRWGPLARGMFRRLAWVSAQTAVYRDRFVALGVPADRVVVGGSLKWDAALKEPDAGEAEALAETLGIDRDRPLIVAGSTGPGEEEVLVRGLPDGCQLLLAPRRPERWDEVAGLVPGMRRRSGGTGMTRGNGGMTEYDEGMTEYDRSMRQGGQSIRKDGKDGSDVILLDTIGELPAAYMLADAAFVGRSLVPMGGSNPLEPVALGKPAVIGPYHENFAGVVAELVAGGGLVVSEDPMAVIAGWLADPGAALDVVEGGRRALERNRGCVRRAAGGVVGLLGESTFVRSGADWKDSPG
ncbi:MAG: hypothetical protein OXU69_16640 [Gemmatimonadota bacterium]|nr:hypothetical protein [Gemmatimonadota bacterium]MDE2986332.1 hypothetical protein [Gemmatimonadota bacterium]